MGGWNLSAGNRMLKVATANVTCSSKWDDREEMARMMPINTEKWWIKNIGKQGGCMEWMSHVAKCMIKMLSNCTQPSCAQAKMFITAI